VAAENADHRPYTWRELTIIWGAILVGVLLLASALVVPTLWFFPVTEPSWWPWLEAVLVNLGAAALLVAPIEWFSSRLRRGVEAAEERTLDAVEEVREEKQADVDALSDTLASLKAFDDAVSNQLDENRAADHALFRSVTAPETGLLEVYGALDRARALSLFSTSYGVRVPYSDGGRLHLGFHPTSGTPGVMVNLWLDNEKKIAHQVWRAPRSAVQLLATFDERVRALGFEERPSARVIFGGLAETLVLAEQHVVARPIIEYFPPQWAVTESRIIAPDRAYGVTHARVDRIPMDVHVKGKRWLDEESYDAAHSTAEALFPLSDRQREYAEHHPRG
jgi:hypothetical protein